MARDYSWARSFLRHDWLTIGELAWLLNVGRHQARRRLLASGLACKLILRRWRQPHEGSWYVRRAYAVPPVTVRVLFWRALERDWRRTEREFARLGMRFSPAHRKLVEELFAPARYPVPKDGAA